MNTPKPLARLYTRTDLLCSLIEAFNYQSYLEIGLGALTNWKRIECARKVGVDPNAAAIGLRMTSDAYFAAHDERFDLIFIDGLHEAAQVDRDIDHALRRLNPQGTIVVHDCNPTEEAWQRVPRPQPAGIWTGDVWKAFVKLRQERRPLMAYVVELDYGCGVIEAGDSTKSKDCSMARPRWKDFAVRKQSWLNLVNTAWFMERLQERKATYLLH